jgi:2-dehydropantoate 2-reductase
METPGVYEQRNDGHLLIGELAAGESERTEQVRRCLGRAVQVRTTNNFRGAVWSKLLLNCSVTTIGAITGSTMREFINAANGKEIFNRTYDEALSIALACGARPERMLVDPIPPGWCGRSVASEAHDAWIGQLLQGYGDAKPSMLQDIQRGRPTEIDFINGYVVSVARRLGVPAPLNAVIVETIHSITAGKIVPNPALLGPVLQAGIGNSGPGS